MSVAGSVGGLNFGSANRAAREEPCPVVAPSAIEFWVSEPRLGSLVCALPFAWPLRVVLKPSWHVWRSCRENLLDHDGAGGDITRRGRIWTRFCCAVKGLLVRFVKDMRKAWASGRISRITPERAITNRPAARHAGHLNESQRES